MSTAYYDQQMNSKTELEKTLDARDSTKYGASPNDLVALPAPRTNEAPVSACLVCSVSSPNDKLHR